MKQKKNAKIAPTSSEKKASNVWQQLEISYENFQKTKSETDSIEFMQFVKDFEIFLKEETNTKLLNYFSPLIIQDITIHVCSITFDPHLILQIFKLFNLIVSKTGVIFSALSYMTLFLFLSNGDEERFNILKNERISIDIFSNENFFNDFISESLFDLSFKKLFLTVSSKEICQFYTNLLFKVSPLNLLSNYDFQPILDSFHQQIPNKTVFPEISVFLSGLFSINDKFKFYFNDEKNFDFFSELVFDAPFDTIIECFTYLIFIDTPNFLILKNIVEFYKKNSRIQNQFFDNGFKLIQLHPEIAIEINSIVPFVDWITPQTSISQLHYVIQLMNSIDTSLVSQFLPSYFSLLLKEDEVQDKLEYYIFGIEISESQIFHHHINLHFLLNSLFLKAFIVQPSTDMLNEIFKKSNVFAQLTYDIYSLPEAESNRHEVLHKIVQVGMKNNELISIVSGFLAISGTSKNLREIMESIETNKNGKLCEVLSFSFLKSDTFVHNFLKEYGLKWIDSIFNKKIIDIQMVKKLIMGLVQRLANQNIDDYIESLPPNHPLFTLEEKDIRSLIYGLESPPAYFPIKIYSLFHLIPCPSKIDPYNASIIGKSNVVKKYENYMNLPIIKEIGNRYITDDIFYLFLKKPTQLEQFADNSYDHFSIFQVFEYTHEKVFDMKFNSISFWFRFESKIDDSLKIPFFHASKFNLFFKKNNLIANYEGTEYEVPINPLQWNHIFVSISPKVHIHKIKIYVNLNKAVFESPTKLLQFEDFGFLVFSTYLFIGPSIRIYKNKTKELNTIFEMGPSSLKRLNEDHFITPSSDFTGDKNMLPVLYKGFPAHFKSERKLNYFFEILKKTNNETEFDTILSLYFKVYLVLKNSNVDLFHSLLTFFALNPEKLTKERFNKILDFFGNNKNKTVFLDEILQNKLIWKNISNDLIIYSLISYFKTFDFYEKKINKLQYFLSSKIICNQRSKYIMTSYLVNSKALPKCQKCMVKLFQCHHYMYQKQSKEIQCSIQTQKNSECNKIINNDDDSEKIADQYLLTINKRNVSIQCDNEENNNNNNTSQFDEQFLLFNEINNTELQFNMIDCFYEFLKKSESVEDIKSILPMDDLMSLFIVSQNNFKSSLLKIFVLIEKKSPGIFIVDNSFLIAFFPLFIYQNVWDEVISLITNNNDDDYENKKIFMNTSYICLILALIWSLTVASLHSVVRTGKPFKLTFDKEIKFCLLNEKIISMNKNTQPFIRTWFPLLLGFENNNNKNENSNASFRIDNVEINPPKVSDFSHHIWKTIIQSAREIDNDIPMKTDKFYLKEFKSFIPNSDLIILLIYIVLSSSKDQFINIFSPILCIPLISKKEIGETFVNQFVTSCLTILSQSIKLESLFIPFSPILYYMSSCGLMKSSFSFILSIMFSIVTLLHDLYSKSFKKALPVINNLLIYIFANCDVESLPLLFNVLQQNAEIFGEIIQYTNSMDIYFCFFQKVAFNCYKEFDLFFKKFLDVSKIDQKNKKVNELLNHVEIQDSSILIKWNKILNSLSSISKTVKNEKSNCFSSTMSEMLNISKEFTKTYFLTQKRQNKFSESLKKIFDSIENAQNSQDYYNYSINHFYESIIQSITITATKMDEINKKHKKLLPFSFPFSLPRLFVPTSIQTPKEVIEFIIENKLYSKEINSISNTNLNKNDKNGLLSENLKSDSEKVPKSLFKRKIKRTKSNCNVDLQSVPAMNVENGGNNQQPLIEKKNQFKRRQSMASHSYSPPDLIFNAIVLNCQLKRFNYSIPTILSIASNELELMPFYNSPFNSEFVSQFVMEVINGFWGITSIFDGKIVIKIPLDSILGICRRDSKSFIFWTMQNGTFILDDIETDIFEKKPFNDMNLFTSQDRAINKNEVIQKWVEGSLSTSQMIVLLNICEGKSYIDQNNFIQFPDSLSVFGTFSPITESLRSNLIEGQMNGSENYSNSIELKDNIDSIVDFIKKLGVTNPIEKLNRASPHFTINSDILCQKISGAVPSFSLFDDNSIVRNLLPLSARISDICPFCIIIDRSEATVNLVDIKTNRKFFVLNSEEFSIAKSISVSKKFMFLSIDFEDNDSCIYQIVYEKGLPSKIKFISKRSFLYNQKTTVNDSELLAATFSDRAVYIWPFYRFSYHRIFNFESRIQFCQFDDNCATLWVCDDFSCFLFDLNGKLFSNYKFEKKISAFAIVPQPLFECERSGICGFYDGSVALISPKIESAELFVKELKKCHQSKIERIDFNPQNTYFLTIDDCQNAFFWTKKNVDFDAKEVDICIFESCPLCQRKPIKFCKSCKRAFCDECLKDSLICPECSSS